MIQKVGVKLLVDNGIVKIPQEFVIPTKLSSQTLCSGSAHLQIPKIDLKGIHEGGLRRKQIIEEIQRASETRGFFEIVNHGISEDVMEDMIKGIRRFHEQPIEVKRGYYTRDVNKKVRSVSTFDNHAKAVSWKETLFCTMAPEAPNPEELPAACGYPLA